MVDSELYGWPKVRAYHRVWLNQIKQGQAMWMEDEVNMYFFSCPCIAHGNLTHSSCHYLSHARLPELTNSRVHVQQPGLEQRYIKPSTKWAVWIPQPILTISMPAATVWLWLAGPSFTIRETATGGTSQSDSVIVGYPPSRIFPQATPLTTWTSTCILTWILLLVVLLQNLP